MSQFLLGLAAGIAVGLALEWIVDWSGLSLLGPAALRPRRRPTAPAQPSEPTPQRAATAGATEQRAVPPDPEAEG